MLKKGDACPLCAEGRLDCRAPEHELTHRRHHRHGPPPRWCSPVCRAAKRSCRPSSAAGMSVARRRRFCVSARRSPARSCGSHGSPGAHPEGFQANYSTWPTRRCRGGRTAPCLSPGPGSWRFPYPRRRRPRSARPRGGAPSGAQQPAAAGADRVCLADERPARRGGRVRRSFAVGAAASHPETMEPPPAARAPTEAEPAGHPRGRRRTPNGVLPPNRSVVQHPTHLLGPLAMHNVVGRMAPKDSDFFDCEPYLLRLRKEGMRYYLLLLAPRRVGKTSLLYRFADVVEREEAIPRGLRERSRGGRSARRAPAGSTRRAPRTPRHGGCSRARPSEACSASWAGCRASA